MSTSRRAGWHRQVSRAANAGFVLGGVSLAVGLFIMTPIANRAPSDDSPSSIAAITLVCLGMAVTMASTGLWAGQALHRRQGRRSLRCQEQAGTQADVV
jgi:hypothetical protein